MGNSKVPRGGFSGRYLSPLNSYSFKRMLATEKNEDIISSEKKGKKTEKIDVAT
ncbi:hypothetical protein HCR18_01905 [Wolbachia pipientis]|uniref:hypothetical protein n=1 Tax=Wolbachia pipientis TaxID=955 RepID=UPI0015FA519B|nr:hypothetical protein [Wolbachia pipientis]MBA8757845.1 hypothetical protein [Wolbachia pipientis]MBA8770010.1 hypothetical protein [Wolbachia pipientis]